MRPPLDSILGDPVVRFRLGLFAVLVAYLVAIVATGFTPLSPVLDVPFALVGWLFLGGLILWAALSRRKYPTRVGLAALVRPLPLAVAFVLLVIIATYFTLGWQVAPECSGVPLSCLKGYQWSIENGRFHHVTADGLSEQISRAAYIQEVGTHLRSAAAFGVYSLCLAWGAAAALQPPTEDGRIAAG